MKVFQSSDKSSMLLYDNAHKVIASIIISDEKVEQHIYSFNAEKYTCYTKISGSKEPEPVDHNHELPLPFNIQSFIECVGLPPVSDDIICAEFS